MTDFREMPYERPDMQKIRDAYEKATEDLKHAPSYAEARTVFFDLQNVQIQLSTMMSLCSVRNTTDLTDPYYDAEIRWLRKESAELLPLRKRYNEALSHHVFRKDFEREFGAQMFRMIDADLRTSDDAIVPDLIREGEICQSYQKDSAAVTEFRGKTCNFYGLLKAMESTDREERKEAYHAWAGLYAQIAPRLDEEYDSLVHLRTEMAHKLGFGSFTNLAYLNRRRFDYNQNDAAAFRAQILESVTPFVAQIREKQRVHLGLDRLCYYDEALLYPDGNAEPIGDMETLVGKAQQMYREMSPETAEFFDFMVRYHLFDLETRPGKRLGGYMTSFPAYQAPFIFSNFNGTSADVDVLTHEAGHAFQGYLAMRSIPVRMLNGSTSEINEIHSMSMEHFAYPWMQSFFGENTEKYITSHLIGAISVLPYMACVDEFQHEMYAAPDLTAAQRRTIWRHIEQKYMPWRDYDGETFLEEGGFWMQKQHIFLYPFYYIDYALAQMCAFQLYGRMKEDRLAAWKDYLSLCRAGGTLSYFELLDTAHLLNPFHKGTVEQSVGHVISELQSRY